MKCTDRPKSIIFWDIIHYDKLRMLNVYLKVMVCHNLSYKKTALDVHEFDDVKLTHTDPNIKNVAAMLIFLTN